MQRRSTRTIAAAPALAVLLLAAPGVAPAQSDTAHHTPARPEHPWSFATSLGRLDWTSGSPGRPSEAIADVFGSLARRWTIAGGFGVQLEAVGGTSVGSISSPFAGARDAAYERSQQRKYAGLVGSAMYQWRTGRSFRPYVRAGMGTYAAQSALLQSCNPDGCVAGPTAWRNAMGLSAGAGFAFRIGGADLFVETAFHQVRDDIRWPNMPLGVGARF
jgi:opacity protein-like surface antigen